MLPQSLFKSLQYRQDCALVPCSSLNLIVQFVGGQKSLAGKFRADHSRAEVTKQGLWVKFGQFPDFVNQVALEQSQARALAYCYGCLHTTVAELSITTETLRHAKLKRFTAGPLTEAPGAE